MKCLAFAVAALLLLSGSAFAAQNRDLNRPLIDVQLSPEAAWALAVIHDAASNRTCTVERAGAGHDPMRPCNVGEKCQVVGTFRMIGATYSIQTIVSVTTP